MELTGKCKEDFEKWYNQDYFFGVERAFIEFEMLSKKSMQFGVYVDFFDSKEYYINYGTWKGCGVNDTELKFYISIRDNNAQAIYGDEIKDLDNSRIDVQIRAIEKACELYNERL